MMMMMAWAKVANRILHKGGGVGCEAGTINSTGFNEYDRLFLASIYLLILESVRLNLGRSCYIR